MKGELLMKGGDNKQYHVHCFRCYTCHHQLIPGDSFVTIDDGSIFCMKDYERIFNQGNAAAGAAAAAAVAASVAASSAACDEAVARASLGESMIAHLARVQARVALRC